MKKRLLIGKIIIVIIIAIFSMELSYIVTMETDEHLFKPIKLLVTFEDTKEFTLENTKKMTQEEALMTYPYVFKIENEGENLVHYQVLLEYLKMKNITRDDLAYILYQDEKEIKKGVLSDLDHNLLYESSLKKTELTKYQLYVYTMKENEDIIYKYQIKVVSN